MQHAPGRNRQDGVSESALRLIPPSVPPLPEPSSLERAELRRKHHLPDGVPVWIYPGDLEFGGGAEIALQGFAAWNRSDAVLLMACRRKTPQADEALTHLRGQAWQWGIEPRVRWVGETRHIHELLALSDFVVMVNRTAYAKMDYPLVALESMCLARPVLVGKGTPSAELADDGRPLPASLLWRLPDRRATEILSERFERGLAQAHVSQKPLLLRALQQPCR